MNKRPREQLFVVADDPHQVHNVAADPKYESVRAELNLQLMSELTRTNDPRVTGDKLFFETRPMAGPLPQPQRNNLPFVIPAPTFGEAKTIGVDKISGTAQAVVFESGTLGYTTQFLPLSYSGELIGADVETQTDVVFHKLVEAFRTANRSDLDHIVKLNVYVANSDVAQFVRRSLAQRFTGAIRPAVSFVQTRLPHPDALVAIDAVYLSEEQGPSPFARLGSIGQRSDFSMPVGQVSVLANTPRIYVSGQAEKGDDLGDATTKTLNSLQSTLNHFGVTKKHVVQIKCFLTPMSEVQKAKAAIAAFFATDPVPNGFESIPPWVFVEWQSTSPIVIELLVADIPLARRDEAERRTTGKVANPREPLEFITPPGMTTSPVFCRAVRVNDPRTIFVSGLYATDATDGAGQVTQVFEQLQDILKASGSDLRHLAKATYYVSDNDASAKLNELRPKFYDPQRPPAASKAQVFGVGLAGRSLTLDMIAVPATK